MKTKSKILDSSLEVKTIPLSFTLNYNNWYSKWKS